MEIGEVVQKRKDKHFDPIFAKDALEDGYIILLRFHWSADILVAQRNAVLYEMLNLPQQVNHRIEKKVKKKILQQNKIIPQKIKYRWAYMAIFMTGDNFWRF